jgi:predicted membrane protein
MAVILEDRPIENIREEVIDTLIYNYSHGVISSQAFERRLDQAMASQNHQEIVDLAADLEKTTDSEFTSQKERQFNVNYAASDNDEIRIITLFGGADIDFTDAIFTTPNVTIKILCLFGGTDISVPEDINIISKAFCILGGIDNSTPSIASRQAPTLTIEGLVMFGGLDIKIKRTIKEKFVAFANQMKTMFNNRV